MSILIIDPIVKQAARVANPLGDPTAFPGLLALALCTWLLSPTLAQASPCRHTFTNYQQLPHAASITANSRQIRARCAPGDSLEIFALQHGQGQRRLRDLAQQLCAPEPPAQFTTHHLRCQLAPASKQGVRP